MSWWGKPKKTLLQETKEQISTQKKGLRPEKRSLQHEISRLKTQEKTQAQHLRALVSSGASKTKIQDLARDLAKTQLSINRKCQTKNKIQNCEERMDQSFENVRTVQIVQNTMLCDAQVSRSLDPRALQMLAMRADKQSLLTQASSEIIDEIVESFADDEDEENETLENILDQIYAEYSIEIERTAPVPPITIVQEVVPVLQTDEDKEWKEMEERLRMLKN